MLKVLLIGSVGSAGMVATSAPSVDGLERIGVGAVTIGLLVWLHLGEIRDRRETALRREQLDRHRDETIAEMVAQSSSATKDLAHAVAISSESTKELARSIRQFKGAEE